MELNLPSFELELHSTKLHSEWPSTELNSCTKALISLGAIKVLRNAFFQGI